MNLELIIRFVTILILGILAVVLVNLPKKRPLFTAGLVSFVITYYLMTLWWPDAREALNATATVVVAGTAILAISLNRQQREDAIKHEKRDRKERLLHEIIEWVKEIQEASLKVEIQVPSGKDVESVAATTTTYETNVLLRYGIPFSRNAYISAIACKAFKEEIQDDIEQAISMFTIFLFLKGKSFGMKNAEQAFRGTYLKSIEEIGKEIETGHKTTEQLLQDYTEKLSYSMTTLLTKIGNVMGNL